MRHLLTVTCVGLLLAACSPYRVSDYAADGNERARDYQLGAGMNIVEFSELQCQPDLGLCGPKDFRMIGGKEQGNIHVSLYNTDGVKVLEYTADDVKAFPGQEIRAEVEKALAEADVQVTTKLLDTIVGSISRIAKGGL